jgi:hypothetical protein
MKKVTMKIGYRTLILDEAVGFVLFKAMNGATIEELESSYNLEAGVNVYYAKQLPSNDFITMTAVADEDYAMWKLTGASK